MTVNPGWGGQAFIDGSQDKVSRLVPLVGKAKIEVDGGIDASTAGSVARPVPPSSSPAQRFSVPTIPAAAYSEIAAAAGAA